MILLILCKSLFLSIWKYDCCS